MFNVCPRSARSNHTHKLLLVWEIMIMVRLVRKERKQQVNEMAQPLHYKVVLKVPFDNTSPDSPLEVVFISKTTKSRGYTHRYIDMSDSEPQHRNQVNKQIELTDDSDDRTSNNLKDREREDITDFANKIADKYGKTSQTNRDTIKSAIIDCYYNVVVNHNVRSKVEIPKDQYWVKYEGGQLIPDNNP